MSGYAVLLAAALALGIVSTASDWLTALALPRVARCWHPLAPLSDDEWDGD